MKKQSGVTKSVLDTQDIALMLVTAPPYTMRIFIRFVGKDKDEGIKALRSREREMYSEPVHVPSVQVQTM